MAEPVSFNTHQLTGDSRFIGGSQFYGKGDILVIGRTLGVRPIVLKEEETDRLRIIIKRVIRSHSGTAPRFLFR